MPQKDQHHKSMIIVKTVTQTCFAAPNCYSGKTAEDCTIFTRYRFGHLSVRLLPAGIDDGLQGASGASIFEADYGESFDGILDYSELRTLTKEIVQWPDAPEEPDPTANLSDENTVEI